MRLEIDTDDHDIEDLIDKVEFFIQSFLKEKTEKVQASELGLDGRIPNLQVGDNFIAVKKEFTQILEYYGGFEYIEEEDIKYMGDYKFYFDSSERVDSAISYWRFKKENS